TRPVSRARGSTRLRSARCSRRWWPRPGPRATAAADAGRSERDACPANEGRPAHDSRGVGTRSEPAMTYVLIPGAGGHAKYWYLVEQELRRRGRNTIAV